MIIKQQKNNHRGSVAKLDNNIFVVSNYVISCHNQLLFSHIEYANND